VTNASVSEDQRVWTFTIRADAAWHDGEPLTADDVAYSLQLYMETAAFPVLHPATTFFESVAVSGEYTVVLTLAEPIPSLQSRLLYLYVLPRHLWADLQGEALLRFVNPEMIGSGPFKVIDYRPGEAVHLAANAN